MKSKYLFTIILIICFLCNLLTSFFYGVQINQRAEKENFQERVNLSISLSKRAIQEGDYRAYIFSTERLFGNDNTKVGIRLYSESDQKQIVAIGPNINRFCLEEAFNEVVLSGKTLQYCQRVSGVIVQFVLHRNRGSYFKFDKLHLLFSLLSALICSLILIWLTRSFLTKLTHSIKNYLESPSNIRLEESFDLIKKPITGLYDTISLLKSKLSESQKAVSLTKDIRQVVHDLGAPLSALSVVISKLNKEESNISRIAETAFSRIQLIIQDLRLRSSIEQNALQSFKIIKELNFSINEFRIQNDDVTLNFSGSSKDLNVFGDKRYFHRVMSCILQNSKDARKLNSPLMVDIKVEFTPLNTSLKITDNGVGINKKNIGIVSLPGVTIGKENNNISGSGLGLSFVYDTLSSWGGSMDLSSEEGKGTTIKLTFLNKDSE